MRIHVLHVVFNPDEYYSLMEYAAQEGMNDPAQAIRTIVLAELERQGMIEPTTNGEDEDAEN